MLKGLSTKDFDEFLKTLDAQRDQAAEKYIALRERLERFFDWRDCENSEELTDIVFDRAVKKISEGEKVKNAEAYCVSIAKFVLLENRREVFKHEELDENSPKQEKESVEEEESGEKKDIKFRCLDECLTNLPGEKRALLIDYFDTDEKTMIPKRKKVAENIGVNLNTLRIRISRLKTKLEVCVKECCAKKT